MRLGIAVEFLALKISLFLFGTVIRERIWFGVKQNVMEDHGEG